MLHDEGLVRFLDKNRPSAGYEFASTYRVLILSPAGRYRARVDYYLDPWEELVSIAARTYRPGEPGSAREIEERDISFRAPSWDSVLMYRDARVMEINIPGAKVGEVVEYTVRLKSKQSFRLSTWSFDGSAPVIMSRLTVEAPRGWEIDWAYWEDGEKSPLVPERAVEGEHERLSFTQTDLPARVYEPQSPLFRGRRLRLVVADAPGVPGRDTFKDWASIGTWYRDFLKDKLWVDDLHWQTVVEAVADDLSAPALYAFVRDRVRYVALYEERLGGFRPHAATDVLKNRLGDCKDKSTLLVALLRRAGIEAYPMLVGTRNRVFFDPTFAATSAFNHAVVALPQPGGDYLILDPTDSEGVYGVTPYHLEEQGALVVKTDSIDLLRVPPAPIDRHRTRLMYAVESPTRVRLHGEFEGRHATGWSWLRRHDPEGLKERLKEWFFTDFGLRKLSDIELKSKSKRVVLSATADVVPMDRRGDGLRVVPLAPFLQGRILWDPVQDRENDVRLRWTGVWEVIVRLPNGRRAEALPSPYTTSTEELDYTFRVDDGPAGVEVYSRVRLRKGIIGRERLDQLRDIDRAIERAHAGAIVFGGDL